MAIGPRPRVAWAFAIASALSGCSDDPTAPDAGPDEQPVAAMVMSADIDGAPTDLSWQGDFIVDVAASVRDGTLSITGFTDPNGLGLGSSCSTCALLNIDLFHELGVSLTTGTYPVQTFGPTGLRAEGTYTPSFSNPDATFGSNDSDPNSQPWSGEVVVQTLTDEVAEGSFELTLYDASGTGPPYPVVVITNGLFRLSVE